MDLSAIRERVEVLQREIAELRAANQAYLTKRQHSSMEIHAQRQRELRLKQILDDLARLTRTKFR